MNLSAIEREKIVKDSQVSLFEDDGKDALNYLIKKRGFSVDIIKKFGIGYISLFENHFLSDKIIFPNVDQYGNLVSISTRGLGGDRIFWHESYEKSYYLYGINNAKNNIVKLNSAIVVEGESDTLSGHQFMFENTVGILGGQMSYYQLSILCRYCQNIYLAFDNDEAGEKNTYKISKLYKDKKLKLLDINMYSIKFPDPEILLSDANKTDLDLYLRTAGRNSFNDLIGNAKKV